MFPALAQPIIVSTVPPSMATGVSPTAPVVFTFNQAMNPSATTAEFMDVSGFPVFLTASSAWSSGNTILTCTPVPSWPEGKMIAWFVEGENPQGDPLDGETSGVFTTGTVGGGGCTNEVGSLTLGKAALYRQTSASAPALQTPSPYLFIACATVACTNLSTTNIHLAIPGGADVNLSPTLIPGSYSFTHLLPTLPTLESGYPAGTYIFTLQSPGNTWPCTVNFPASLVIPNAPYLTAFPAIQAVDPSQPFVLGWEAFQGGTAQDSIHVELYGDVFQTPPFGLPGSLPGTAQSVTIPADTLDPGRSYDGAITFYDLLLTTNSCGYISLVYYSATTEFSLVTAGGAPPLAITRTPTNTVVVSWPAPAENWILERTNALPIINAPWPAVPPPYQNDGARLSAVFTNAPPAGNQFFRLRKP
jgi:hypothetical protein